MFINFITDLLNANLYGYINIFFKSYNINVIGFQVKLKKTYIEILSG